MCMSISILLMLMLMFREDMVDISTTCLLIGWYSYTDMLSLDTIMT